MTYIKQTAYALNDKSDKPNQILAQYFADTDNHEGIEEMVNNLSHENKNISSDCIKVLYETAYIKPELILDYWATFIELLNNKSNRLVWGGMIALSQITPLIPEQLYHHLQLIINKIHTGTVITSVHGVNVLAKLTAFDEYYDEIMPILLSIFAETRAVDVPKRAEIISLTLKDHDQALFLDIIQKKEPDLSKAGLKRIQKVIKTQNKDKA